MAAIAINPVAVAIEADALQNYKSGVFSASCGDNIDVRCPTPYTCLQSRLPSPPCRAAQRPRGRLRHVRRLPLLRNQEQLGRQLGREGLHPARDEPGG